MASAKKTDRDTALATELAQYYADPLGYVLFVFPWDTYKPIQLVQLPEKYRDRFPNVEWGPDAWACAFLDDVGNEVKKRNFTGHTAVDPIQMATASGHGIGKSVLVAWLIKWIMDTRPFSKGTVTANTAEQLKTKTWAELGKWHKMSVTEHWFIYNSGRGAMNLAHKKHKEEWRCDAQTCREENSEAFAGQHAASATSFYIFDEASAVPDKIFEVREGGTTDGEPMVFDFGNPTRNSGRFFEHCAGRFRHRYKVRCIDSRDVAITNKDRIKQWLDDYGEDSDFFKVRVRGMFPTSGNLQFISTAAVEEAQQREVPVDQFAPLLIGVDVARFGDNESVIYPRVGYDARSWPVERFQGLDTVQLVGKIIECVRGFRSKGLECSGLFVDGGGVGGGVIDQLRSLGYAPSEVQFGSKAINTKTYRYRSDEMWGNMRDALPKLCLPANNQPNGIDLRADLTQREFGYTLQGNRIHLETKKDMIARGVTSPDIGDALALTFAQQVAPLVRPDGIGPLNQSAVHEYDPLEMTF
jgi:hypothetical protein